MKRLSILILLAFSALPGWIAAADDAEGCADLKQFPRLEGCSISECSAKHHDSFDIALPGSSPFDADTNSVTYSCPLSDPQKQPRNPQKMTRDFDAQLRKAGYISQADLSADGASTIGARKDAQYVHWSASVEDSAISYSLTVATTAPKKLEVCAATPQTQRAMTALNKCNIMECSSKSEDSAGIRTSVQKVTPLTGKVQSLTLACPAQPFENLEHELSKAGFDILFTDNDSSFTAHSGEHWVQFGPSPNGESNNYALTVVSSAEELDSPEPPPPPDPPAAPEPAQNEAQPAPPPADDNPPPADTNPPAALARNQIAPEVPAQSKTAPSAQPYQAVFEYPKPIVQVPIEPTPERVANVRGSVVIRLLVDVDEQGAVTKAVLTGRTSDKVLKLQGAAIEAVSQWRFKPARQDGRIVACVKIPVEIHFQGRQSFSRALTAFK